MLTLSQLSKSYGGRELFRDVSLQVNPGERIGLVGPNGAGKSTLFSLILGENDPDEGRVVLSRGVSVGFLPQESMPPAGGDDTTVLRLATAGLEIGQHRRGPAEAGDDHHHPEDDDDPGALAQRESQAKRVLRGLAFREEDFLRPARTFSGGWVMRAHLARLLVQAPDLLMLDEPTNHLDLESLQWFQSYLAGYPGAVLMISHDREFLNQLAESIVEIAHARLVRYRGNYEAYLLQRATRREQQLAAYKAQQREIADLQRFADRFRAKASKASQAQSKLKQIARLERVEAPEAEAATIKFRFPQPPRGGQKAIELAGVDHAYPNGHVTYRGLDFVAERGDRTVLVGPNGAGKSTLLKLLAGVLPFQAGRREPGLNVSVGYYAQHRLDALEANRSVLEEVLASPRPVNEQMARTVLGSFLFRGDDAFKPVGVLSGGEKSRLALVKLLLDPPNLLLMDEPTTHLDMASIDALIQALGQYEGTIVFVSHDVYFIRAVTRKVLHVEAGRLTPYHGDYDYFLEKRQTSDARGALVAAGGPVRPPGDGRMPGTAGPARPGPTDQAVVGVRKTKEQKRAEAEARNVAARERRERQGRVKQLENEIIALEQRQRELTRELEDEATYRDPARPLELNRALTSVVERLQRLTREWEGAAEPEETPVA